MATKKAARKTAPVKASGILVGEAKELYDLKREVKAALEFMKSEGTVEDLCDEGKSLFAKLAKLSGANIESTYASAMVRLYLDDYNLPVGADPYDYLNDATFTVKGKDGQVIGVDSVEVDDAGSEI